MTFKTVPFAITGPSYQSRSRPVSSQATINFYQEFDESGKAPYILQSWPGLSDFGGAAGNDRGIHVMSNVTYRVVGGTLYKIGALGFHQPKGAIPGFERCIFADDGESLFIVNAGFVYQYNDGTGFLTEVTDPDIAGSIAVDFLNNQFIYTKPDLFIISDVGNGAEASGLNAAQAESQPDSLVRAYVFQQIAYMFGEETCEPWYNSGTGSPPFDRIDTRIISVGLGGIHSIANTDNFMYWIGDDRQVYQATGGTANRVSSIGVSNQMESYETVSDAIGSTITIQGQNFYILSFPTVGKTWALNESLGKDGWFELSSGTTGGQYQGVSFASASGVHYVGSATGGQLYTLDIDAYTNGGDPIKRTRVTSSVHGGMVGEPGKRIQMSRFEMIIDAGVGLIDGQGEDPKIMVEASYDGGKSFEAGTWMRVGRMGETNVRAEWFSMKSFYDLVIRFTTTDPVQYTFISAAIDLRLAGR